MTDSQPMILKLNTSTALEVVKNLLSPFGPKTVKVKRNRFHTNTLSFYKNSKDLT
jgi:hypothetical protein